MNAKSPRGIEHDRSRSSVRFSGLRRAGQVLEDASLVRSRRNQAFADRL
jgi:hypothetical protein